MNQQDLSGSAEMQHAYTEWESLLGVGNVMHSEDAQRQFGSCTTGVSVPIAGALKAASAGEVVEIVRVAAKYKIPVYPISTGKNWGYTSAHPVKDNCVILDLSGMKKIIELDENLGIVTIEPGVTQQDLYEYIQERGLPFLTPITGAGPDCSIVGNALERGYGVTPIADHFQAVTALKAVLASGETYVSGLEELGGAVVDRALKWGIGPYLDGIFSQANVGIVTEMTIALARRFEYAETFYFWVDEDRLEETVEVVQSILQDYGSVTGSINLMNVYRMLAMGMPYPKDVAEKTGGVLQPEDAQRLARRNLSPDWMGIGCLYGTKKMVKAAKGDIKKRLKGPARRVLFFSERQVKTLRAVGDASRIKLLSETAAKIQETFNVFLGIPTTVSQPIAQWKMGEYDPDVEFKPTAGRSGLIWYAPLIPFDAETARAYTDMVKRVCLKHRIEPITTLTTLSERCIDSSVPILFDKTNAEELARAHACHDELLEEGIKQGWVPYRLGSLSMGRLVDGKEPYWQLVGKIKQALDPDNIIAPGRYSPF